jgi:hypothetical protein
VADEFILNSEQSVQTPEVCDDKFYQACFDRPFGLIALEYLDLIQSGSPTAENPSWASANGGNNIASIAVFIQAGGTPPASSTLIIHGSTP